jgi:hypothetical protein
MRSLSADAAIVAAPTRGATFLAVRSVDAARAVVAPAAWLPHPLLLMPAYATLGLALTWMAYQLVAGLLEYRAISTTNGRGLFILLAVLTGGFAMFDAPSLAPPFAAAALGGAFALSLIRRRPSRRISAN